MQAWSKDGARNSIIWTRPTIFSRFRSRDAGGALQFGAGQTLVTNWTAPNIFYDVTPDDKKILLNRVSQQVSQSVTLVSNWTEEVKK